MSPGIHPGRGAATRRRCASGPGSGFRSGGPGKTTSLYIRGAEADHVLVLLDGIKVGSATTGDAAYQLIPLYQIERIEILRGPQSSLYGSEA